MNKEIKEILEFDFESQGERIEINEYERNMLKDYITNSQEENEYSNHCNEELRKKITNLEYKIERLEEENTKLKELCDKYEEEHSTTFEEWKKDINIIDELEKYINEVNNMVTTRDIKENVYICGRYDENLDILDKLNELKGSDKE